MMNDSAVSAAIEQLLSYAELHGLIRRLDRVPARNALLDLFHVADPGDAAAADVAPDRTAPELLEPLLTAAVERGLMEDDTNAWRDLMDARIMGLLMPRASELADEFARTAQTAGIREATDRYYKLSIASNYIRMDRIAKNEYWTTPTEYGELEITVNLSKPEKDPKEIAAERAAPQVAYPKCLLCVDNVGYAGRINHPARQNHRVIPLQLLGDPWYFQYSPYVYYNEHSILFSESHTPMTITARTFERLLDFVSQFPHYFIGSNADLPIVGGSILSHDHFQAGRHVFAMEKAPVEAVYSDPEEPEVKVGTVKWPMSVIRLTGAGKESLLRVASRILALWRGYNDAECEVFAETVEADGSRTPHNTITPIARRTASGDYELDLVLRNNRRTAEHPDGLFHPHRELHHIKKENIGLIEVMGLAVLPGRLKSELELIVPLLTGEAKPSPEMEQDPSHPLHKHADWIHRLLSSHAEPLGRSQAKALLQAEVGHIFKEVLQHAGVYKRAPSGASGFASFMKAAGFRSFS